MEDSLSVGTSNQSEMALSVLALIISLFSLFFLAWRIYLMKKMMITNKEILGTQVQKVESLELMVQNQQALININQQTLNLSSKVDLKIVFNHMEFYPRDRDLSLKLNKSGTGNLSEYEVSVRINDFNPQLIDKGTDLYNNSKEINIFSIVDLWFKNLSIYDNQVNHLISNTHVKVDFILNWSNTDTSNSQIIDSYKFVPDIQFTENVRMKIEKTP